MLAEPTELGRFAESLRQPVLDFVGVAFDGLLRTLINSGVAKANAIRIGSENRAKNGFDLVIAPSL